MDTSLYAPAATEGPAATEPPVPDPTADHASLLADLEKRLHDLEAFVHRHLGHPVAGTPVENGSA